MKKNLATEIKRCEKETKKRFEKINQSVGLDRKFALEGDEPLTEDEIKQIDEYWGRYSFAYPNIDYKSFETFKNRYGKFDVRHCPGVIRKYAKFYNPSYKAFQHKAMLTWLFPDIKHPDVVVRYISKVFFDEECNIIDEEQAVDGIMKYCENNKGVILKVNYGHGGKQIFVMRSGETTPKVIRSIFKQNKKKDYVVQGLVEQSEFTKQFNDSSVNTVRMTTLLFKDQVHVLAGYFRTGQNDSGVDNWSSGGAVVGIDLLTGKLNDTALRSDAKTVCELANGINLKGKEYYVPGIRNIVEVAKKCHCRIPQIKLISWDLALDANDEPVLIEANFGGMTQLHEAITGPLYGDLTDELLDDVLLKKFHIEFAEKNFLAHEYHDHIIINEYIGSQKVIVIPDELRGKLVKKIKSTAFEGMNIEEVVANEQILKRSKAALKGIKTRIKTDADKVEEVTEKKSFISRVKKKLKL